MKILQSTFAFLHRVRFLHFFLTGVSGVLLNMLITWFLTHFVFGIERYYIGYIIGTLVNISYNFAINSILTFRTTKDHGRRFILFILFNAVSTIIQFTIVDTLVRYFGHAYYLLIIAGTIFALSIISFIFFKHALFNEGTTHKVLTPKQELGLLISALTRARENLLKTFSKDINVIIFIVALAMITRLPFLSHPNITLFDEVIYEGYAIETIDRTPFFDIHPPLARMIYAELASTDDTPHSYVISPMIPNQYFNNFPYVTVRLFTALLGILLPVIIYAISRLVGFRPYIALIPALFVILDNALIIYSRTMLPDMMILVANFGGLLLTLTATQARNRNIQLLAILLAGIFLGAAISIKWTALAMLALAILWLAMKRSWIHVFILFSTAIIFYVGIFFWNFTLFHQGGKIQPILPAYSTPWILDRSYPPGTDAHAIFQFIPEYHEMMFQSNRDPRIISQIQPGPHPITWSVSRSTMTFWVSPEKDKSIILTGNSVLWIIAFFAFLFELAWLMAVFFRSRKWMASDIETLLIVGYLMNYIPFFFIGRSMFLYHYFPALIILFLLIPFITPRIIHCTNMLARDKYLGQTLVALSCFIIFIYFILLSATTYGF